MKPFQQLASKPRPERKLRKRPCMDNKMVYNNLKEVVSKKLLVKQPQMRAECLQDPTK